MLEEALKVFGLNNVCSLKDLDIIYKKMVRKNYEENFPYNKEIGLMNVRIYEWSYQIILPFALMTAILLFQQLFQIRFQIFQTILKYHIRIKLDFNINIFNISAYWN